MINFLSNYIVNFFVKKEFIKNEEKPIYVYGYQIILMSLLGILIISILGIILK
ncbi:hypothetical protein GCM10023142_14420 [Anaerocolumna aminovalerica]|uniref:Accessory gene regulator B n=1 Tax=Anaerocolumna aminovalerica TaxID=1527 RepID=A0A1I5F779_9FIRM|nr:accessory gene regulator B family protein [Anaerocolumna aminovalerica]SFO19584.1 Accessory gene regulator B [Anaerocolumna aminovalerica]